ncbi:MAG: sialidase family protein, partial [Acidimicrobiales bacterium]
LTFQARIAVGGDGTIFATWMAVEDVGTLSVIGPTRIVASRSTDGGATFSPPAAISDSGRERVGAAEPVIDSEGDLVVVYVDFKDDRRDFENLEGPAWDQPLALVITRSSDGGESFSAGRELEAGLILGRRFLVYLPELPSVAAGPEGALYVAWTDGRSGDEDVLLRRSGDGGRTWDDAVRVHDEAVGDGTTQHLPAVDVDEAGRVSVAFLDRRRDPDDVMSDAHLAASSDGGRSFTDIRLTDEAFDTRVGPVTAQFLGVDLGSRIGLSTMPGSAITVWTDTRLGTEDTGRQDIAAATVAFTERETRQAWALPLATVAILGLALITVLALRARGSSTVDRS